MRKSLSIGKQAEKFVANLLENSDIEILEIAEGKVEEYDLHCKIGRKKFKGEVKYDVMAQKTGNIAIEFWNSISNKHSGVNVTKANIWFHVVLDDNNMTVWAINVQTLKDFIDKNPPKRVVHLAGDGNASLYLYADTILAERFIRLDNVDSEEIKKRIKKLI